MSALGCYRLAFMFYVLDDFIDCAVCTAIANTLGQVLFVTFLRLKVVLGYLNNNSIYSSLSHFTE